MVPRSPRRAWGSIIKLSIAAVILCVSVLQIRAQFDDMPGMDMGMGDMYGDMGMGDGGYGDGYGYDGYGDDYGDPSPYSRGLPKREIISVEDLETFIEEDPLRPAVVGFFGESETKTQEMNEFGDACQTFTKADVRAAVAVRPEVMEALQFSATANRVMAYPARRFISTKYDRKQARFPGKIITTTGLLAWVPKAVTTVVGVMLHTSDSRYAGLELPIVTVFAKIDLFKDSKGYDYIANRVRRVAGPMKGIAAFAIVDHGNPQFVKRLAEYGITLNPADTSVAVWIRQEFYMMEDAFSPDAMKAFVAKALNRELTPLAKLSPEAIEELNEKTKPPPPPEEFGEHVVQLDDTNFDEKVHKAGKDAVVLFYAPWCTHCKSIKAPYSELAMQLQAVDQISVAAYDADAFQPPKGYKVEKFPTIYFIPDGNAEEAHIYHGERDLTSMFAFVQGQLTNT